MNEKEKIDKVYLSCGWLSPKCKFYECSYQEHYGLAKKLAKKYKLDVEDGFGYRTRLDDALLAAGWFKITRLCFLGDGKILVVFPNKDELTLATRTAWRKSQITDKHRKFFREEYFNNPYDWNLQSLSDMVQYGILDYDEVISWGDDVDK